MARQSLGDRRQMNVRLPATLIKRIDEARGRAISRDSWIEHAAELALRPTSVIADPELRQIVHEHTIGRPIRTEMRGNIKVRVHECAGGCGIEVVTA